MPRPNKLGRVRAGDRGRVCMMRSPRALMVLAFAGQATVVVLAGWYDRSVTLGAAEDHVELTVGLMHEYALNVFQTQELVHEQIGLRTAGFDWEAISSSDA